MDEGGYESKLSEECGAKLSSLKQALGHCGGVHGDNMYLIARLTSLPEVSNVLEFGSGLSSLVFGKIKERTGKNMVSLEDHPHWVDVANNALSSLGMEHRVTGTRCDPSLCPDFEEDFQVVFVDGNIFHNFNHDEYPGDQVCKPDSVPHKYVGRFGACFYYEENLRNAVLIFDDAESLVQDVKKHVVEIGRDPAEIIVFNPTGRSNRHQHISLPEQNKEIYRQLIEEVANL
ncbi:hypothetical protein LCGC14_0747550 [marine sediment metagenome]|uniref:Methyltransferase domain-containing protein n=1 Tax=marine sediment metagenome TaxID=412755 RepID=A0A0F9SPY8_9ZZZZ